MSSLGASAIEPDQRPASSLYGPGRWLAARWATCAS